MGDAKKEILSLLSKQFDNGLVPHMIYWDKQSLPSEDGESERSDSSTTKVTVERDGKVIGQSAYRTDGSLKQQHAKLGRNDPCWCGSGKKYKKCHYPN